MKKQTEENHMTLFMTMIAFKKTSSYGVCHVRRPSCFWPDVEVNHAEEIAQWKKDLIKEQKGTTEFRGGWGMGTNFEKPLDIEVLLNAFRVV